MKLNRYLMVFGFISIFFYLFVCQLRASWPFTIDDMYITLRYADHWAKGIGLLWNANELPVEGYSNFSFVLLGRVALELGFNPVIILKSAGILGLFLSCIGLYGISRYWFLPRLAIIPSCWMLAYQGEILWGVSGLETSIYQALVIGSLFYIFKGLGYYLKAPHEKEKSSLQAIQIESPIKNRSGLLHFVRKDGKDFFRLIIAGFLLAMAAITRPEAPALVLLFSILIYFNRPNMGKKILFFLSAFLILFLPYFCWRWHYYGQLFPNPVYCKGANASLRFILDKQFLKLIWPFGLMSLIALVKIRDKRLHFLWLPSILYCVLLMNADPIVAFYNRLFLPAFALILPLTLISIDFLIKKITPNHLQVILTYLISILWVYWFIPLKSLSGYQYFIENPLQGEKLRMSVVTWLENHTTANAQVVLADSGLIPYRSDRRFIDSYCLNNHEMAQLSTQIMFTQFCKEIFNQKPEIIILTSLIEKGKLIYTPADSCLAKKLATNTSYQLKHRFSTQDQTSIYQYEIYQRG